MSSRRLLQEMGPLGMPDPIAICLGSYDTRSLYRGVVPPLLGVTPIFAVSFWVRAMAQSEQWKHIETLYRHTICRKL